MTHNKNQNPLLNLLINCIPARSATQILCIKDNYTFRFLNFLIIGLSNSSANCLFSIIANLSPIARVSDDAQATSTP